MQSGHKRLPPLDLFVGFEAAARHLSFTKAAQELFLTQSAISRQVQSLEEQLGVTLFQRRHRALLLTDEGQMLYRTAASVLAELRGTVGRISAQRSARLVTVTAMVTFASLWLVPRLPAFRKLHPEIDVHISADNELVDLERSRIDVAIRYTAQNRAPPQGVRLFGESILPVCSPALLRDPQRPLREPGDLRHHVLLHLDDAPIHTPWLEWRNWFEAMKLPGLVAAGSLLFSHYDQLIASAVEGQGVALGRLPMLNAHIRQGRLVAPFERTPVSERPLESSRAFYVLQAPGATARAEVRCFTDWLLAEAGAGLA